MNQPLRRPRIYKVPPSQEESGIFSRYVFWLPEPMLLGVTDFLATVHVKKVSREERRQLLGDDFADVLLEEKWNKVFDERGFAIADVEEEGEEIDGETEKKRDGEEEEGSEKKRRRKGKRGGEMAEKGRKKEKEEEEKKRKTSVEICFGTDSTIRLEQAPSPYLQPQLVDLFLSGDLAPSQQQTAMTTPFTSPRAHSTTTKRVTAAEHAAKFKPSVLAARKRPGPRRGPIFKED